MKSGPTYSRLNAGRMVVLFMVLGLVIGPILFSQASSHASRSSFSAARSVMPDQTSQASAHEVVSLAGADQTTRLRTVDSFGKIPLSFELNTGQTDNRVRFLSRGNGYMLFLTSNKAVFSLQRPVTRGNESAEQGTDVLQMMLVGANPASRVEGRGPLTGKSNYFIGKDPKKWRVNVPSYGSVYYKSIYKNVDLIYYGNQRQLENDFLLAPGADPHVINLMFAGAKEISTDAEGNLLLGTASGQVQLQKPVIYQMSNGVRREVAGKYALKESGAVGFEVAEYDHSAQLVIDPVLVYSTYLGGTGQDSGNGIAVDSAGNAYVVGDAGSASFPTFNSNQAFAGVDDVFITKFNASGSGFVYSTFLGGTTALEHGYDIAVDVSGNAYVTGVTNSSDFPTTTNALQPHKLNGTADAAFLTKLNTNGTLGYSTFLSGTQSSRGFGVATFAGFTYVTGQAGAGFPLTASAFSSTSPTAGFLTVFDASSGFSLKYSSYLGPTGFAEGRAIAVGPDGSAYITGTTNSTSTNFTTPGAFQTTFGGGTSDAFVAKFNPFATGNASRIYSTYLGGSGQDFGGYASAKGSKAIAVDSYGTAFITGQTNSTNFPVINAAQPNNAGYFDAFVTRLSADGSVLAYSTYLGGGNLSVADSGLAIAVNGMSEAYVTGHTESANFPLVSPLTNPGSTTGGVFVTKLDKFGLSLLYSTRLGRPTIAIDEAGQGIALDSASNVFVTGFARTEFPTVGAFQPGPGGSTDAFVSEIADPTIVGRVLDENFEPIADATVTLSGNVGALTRTELNGNFEFNPLPLGGTYTVSVNLPNYIFPVLGSDTVNNLQKNVRIPDFLPTLVGISGHVTNGSVGLGNVQMTLSGGKALTGQTDTNGSYFFGVPAGRDYQVTPSKSGYTFVPASRNFDHILANQIGDFSAQPFQVQFSLASYSVNENAGTATISVTRNVGQAGPISVDYKTTDASATQRTDYTTTTGTLHFADTDTTKSFVVPIVDDLYVEGNETINLTLSNPVGAILGSQSQAVLTITDNDVTTATTNPLDNADEQFFVRQHYLDLLNRDPDPGGFAYWISQITACGSDQLCQHHRRIAVSDAFFFELEYQQTGSYVFRLYRAAYGNHQPFPNPDPMNPTEAQKLPSYAVFSSDRGRVIGGPNQAQGQLELANDFVQRPEFLAKYPSNLTGTQFVDALLGTVLIDVGVDLTSQRQGLITLFNSGGRGAVMYRLADDNAVNNPINNRAFIDGEYSHAFVFTEYAGYLRRDSDIGGYLFWLDKVDDFPVRDFNIQHTMVCAFITSREYQQRFSPVVTRANSDCAQ